MQRLYTAPVLLARAFWFSVTPRAVLAIAAVALAVAYALVAVGAVTALGTESAAVERAKADPGFALVRPDGAAFPDDAAPEGALLLRTAFVDGARVATLEPWPFDAGVVFASGHVGPVPAASWSDGLSVNRTRVDFAPPDAFTVPPERFAAVAGERAALAVAAFVAGPEAPQAAGFEVVPWRGVGEFYSAGAEETRSALGGVVLAAGFVTALLSSGFVHLEVQARRRDLATVEALAGRRLVDRLVIGRAVVLVGLGMTFGLVLAAVVLRLGHLVGTASFALDPLWTTLVLVVAGGAGVFAGTLAGMRAYRRHRPGSQPDVERFKGPVRFLFVTPRVFAGVFVAALLATTVLTVVIETAAIPVELFGEREDTVVLLESQGNPLRGQADRFLGEHAHRLEEVEAAMPETYAPTIWNGHPLLVKGTAVEAWRTFAAPGLVSGDWPQHPGEAMAGARVAARLGLSPGDVVIVPMSYHVGVERLRVVGVHETGGLADDELFVDLDTAGRLAGVPADKTTLVRIRLADPGLSWSSVAPSAGIAFVDLSISPERPPPLTPATVEVRALNFAGSERVRGLAVRLDGVLVASETVRLEGHGESVHRFPILTPAATTFELQVNPTREVGASLEGLVVAAPGVARPGERIEVTVRDTSGAAAPGAELLVDGVLRTTADTAGRASLTLDAPALVTLSALRGELAGGTQVRVAPAAWDDEARIVVERLFVHPSEPLEDGRHRVRAEAVVVNLGGSAGEASTRWQVDGDARAALDVSLPSAVRRTVVTTVTVTPGAHEFSLFGVSVGFTTSTVSSGPEAPRSIEEVLAAKRAEARSGGGDGRTAPFLEDVFAGFGTATAMVMVATLLHTGSLVWVAVVREVRERQEVVRTLRALGAGDHQIEWRSVRDTFLSAAPAILAGVTLAVVLLALGRAAGWPVAFGHVLPTGEAWGVRIKTGVALLVIAFVAAFYAVQGRRRRAVAVEEPKGVRELVGSAR